LLEIEKTQLDGGAMTKARMELTGDWLLSRAVNGREDVATPGTEGNIKATISIPITEVIEVLRKAGYGCFEDGETVIRMKSDFCTCAEPDVWKTPDGRVIGCRKCCNPLKPQPKPQPAPFPPGKYTNWEFKNPDEHCTKTKQMHKVNRIIECLEWLIKQVQDR
jgi:hypothetical protein